MLWLAYEYCCFPILIRAGIINLGGGNVSLIFKAFYKDGGRQVVAILYSRGVQRNEATVRIHTGVVTRTR